MKKNYYILIGFLFTSQIIFSQYQKTIVSNTLAVEKTSKKSEAFTCTMHREIHPVSIDLAWRPMLNTVCIKHHSEDSDEYLENLKNTKALTKISSSQKTNAEENASNTSTYTPVIGSNFIGNANNGYTPMDNSVAISNAGYIVSVANTTISFYNTSGTMTFLNTIDAFFNDVTISTVCDPVVIYDSGSDRFIFFAQECSGNSSNSNLLVCFSKSNDPNSGWWTYKINGNPVGNSTWFDYPKIAVSNNELYITGNSFNNSGSFVEALLYQIEKTNGYSGGTLNWQYWHNLDGNPFTLLPVSFGQQGNYGPGCYLISTLSSGGSIVNFYDLTDDMSSASETINHSVVNRDAYSPAANADQLGTTIKLDNGDCRALSGFYLNGDIHYVFHSEYAGTGYNGINYNRLNLTSGVNTTSTFGTNSAESSYPSVASFGTDINDKSVMIGFGRSNNSMYPEVRVVSCDHVMRWSNSELVKSGEGYVDITGGAKERWGDYSGMCRKQNSTTPKVWMNGMFGTALNTWDTWIAEIGATGNSGVSTEDIKKDNTNRIYPNLVNAEFYTEFSLDNSSQVIIEIYDNTGKMVKELYNAKASSGKNVFTFNKSNLSSGTYFVSIKSNNQLLKNEKIIINN